MTPWPPTVDVEAQRTPARRAPKHAPQTTCQRCGTVLSGGITHDAEADCVNTLVPRARIREAALKNVKSQLDRALKRLESWKLKAQTASVINPSPGAVATGKRLAVLEVRADAAEKRSKQLSEEIGQLNQQVKFLMGQLCQAGAKSELRRAS